VVAVAAEVSAGTQVGEAGWSVGVGAGVGSAVGVVDGPVGPVCCWLDGLTGADGVAAAEATGGVVAATTGDGGAETGDAGAGLAAAGDATVGGAGEADATVANEWRTLSTSGAWGLAGGENREVPESDPYQESNPGATTPMSGIWSGPAASGESMAAVAACPWGAADVRTASAAGAAVVWARARSEAIVSPTAPAPSTGAAREERGCVLCLLMYPVPSGPNEPPS
jgi:hypothetical protein